MIVDLASDWEEIQALAQARQSTKRSAGLRNKRLTRRRSELQTEVDGLIGEFAVSRGLGIEPVLARRTDLGGDGGRRDGVWDGWSYEAKYTPYPHGVLIVNDLGDLMKCVADVFVLVTAVRGEPQHIARLAGAISRQRFMQLRELRNLGYGPCPCVAQAQLAPFERFASGRRNARGSDEQTR